MRKLYGETSPFSRHFDKVKSHDAENYKGPCPKCGGRGHNGKEDCPDCRGTGEKP
jgi:DnaJ-class molecular chaperone